MAKIISLLREELNQSLLENGVAGVGGLQVGEFGYNADAAALEFSYRKRSSSGFVHVPTRERLILAAAAASSGAKIIGYFPSAGLSSTTVQDAIDELRGQVAAGGGGTLLGSGTTGKIPKFSGASTLTDSILSEASSKLLFEADTVANLYRSAASVLKTDGGMVVAGNIEVGTAAINGEAVLFDRLSLASNYFFGSGAANFANAFHFAPSLTKNNTNARTFYGMEISATLNPGGSNANTTFDVFHLDTINNTTTGLTTNLMRLLYGGSQRFKLTSAGELDLTLANGDHSFWVDAFGVQRRLLSGYNSNEWVAADASGRVEFIYRRARGDQTTPANVSSGDIVAYHVSTAYSGSSYMEGGKFQWVVDGSFVSGQNPPQRMEFYTAPTNAADALRLALMSNGNIGFHTTSEFGDGVGVLGIQNAATVPTTNPTGGGVLYPSAGGLYWRGSSGTVTLIAPA